MITLCDLLRQSEPGPNPGRPGSRARTRPDRLCLGWSCLVWSLDGSTVARSKNCSQSGVRGGSGLSPDHKDGVPRTGGAHGQGEQHHLHHQPPRGDHRLLESQQPGTGQRHWPSDLRLSGFLGFRESLRQDKDHRPVIIFGIIGSLGI